MNEAVFHGGPADGTTLSPSRLPIFLRVVVDAGGVIDCLCALDDEPTEGETVHAYRRRNALGHACTRGTGGRCYTLGSYDHMPRAGLRFDDSRAVDLRDRDTWEAWANAQAPVR